MSPLLSRESILFCIEEDLETCLMSVVFFCSPHSNRTISIVWAFLSSSGLSGGDAGDTLMSWFRGFQRIISSLDFRKEKQLN